MIGLGQFERTVARQIISRKWRSVIETKEQRKTRISSFLQLSYQNGSHSSNARAIRWNCQETCSDNKHLTFYNKWLSLPDVRRYNCQSSSVTASYRGSAISAYRIRCRRPPYIERWKVSSLRKTLWIGQLDERHRQVERPVTVFSAMHRRR